ncbi:MAG: deoxyribose-phosphate aldolase, partial [Flavobacteriales bacterium]|nr:deoxyribose-phosphate aldolase [Flavobacteriales bacterium]
MSIKKGRGNLILPDFAQSSCVDKVGVEERVARFQSRSIKNEAKMQGLKMALNMIDLTTLEGKDTPGKVKQMCYKAQHLHDFHPNLPSVAAVCVYPTMVGVAAKAVQGSGVKVASVSTAFPSGQAPLDVKIRDTKFAVDEGADEIDMVISRGKFLSGEYNFVFDEIAAIKEACGKSRLKVI